MTNSTTENLNNKRNRARMAFIALVILFSIPVIGPFFYTPKNFVNRGALIQPQARTLESLQLINEQGTKVGVEVFQGKWTMLIFDHADCDEACQTNLYNIRQVRLTQGRRMVRIQLAWILLSGQQSEIDSKLLTDYPQVQRYNIPSGQIDMIDGLFKTEFGQPSNNLNRIYFVDPFGNLVMSFAADQNPKDMQKDLGRLLRVSGAGENQN